MLKSSSVLAGRFDSFDSPSQTVVVENDVEVTETTVYSSDTPLSSELRYYRFQSWNIKRSLGLFRLQ